MLLLAQDPSLVALATDIAAVIEERDPLTREAGADINLRIEALRRSRSTGSFANKFNRIEKVAASYRRMLNVETDNGAFDPNDTGLLLAYAYPERIASARPGNNAQFQLANGKYAMLPHTDDLAHEPWLTVALMDMREGQGKIFLASALNPKDLIPMVKETEKISWDTRKGGLIAVKEMKIGSIVLQSKPLHAVSNESLSAAVSEAIRNEGEQLLDFTEEMIQLQNRILSLRTWNDDNSWPDVSTGSLISSNDKWLGPYLGNIKKPEDLKRLDLHAALLNSLEWEQQQSLAKLAPPVIEVPSGSKIRIRYFANGATPVMAVRLQEVFGLADTPSVNNGRMKVVLHLLSPGYKPVQVTSDLRSFWDNLYFEVKKELQRRYPKHSWPDDPWSARAVAKGRSHK
jgi:ATP-dependent helicase HrpB